MSKLNKKNLPKNFEEILKKGNLKEIKEIFANCDLNARGGLAKQTAIAFATCPSSIIKWLVKQGADINATDLWGNTPLHQKSQSRKGNIKVLIELGANINFKNNSIGTPLHSAANSHNAKNVEILIQNGAKVNEINKNNFTALELALYTCANIDIIETLEIAKLLLDVGAKKTVLMKNFVEKIGKQFEFHRKNFDPKSVKKVDTALIELYKLFSVTPIKQRMEHDLKSKISVKTKSWQSQHKELWELLVPSSGSANTIQGELIRISGRIANELEVNGGINWDKDYILMTKEFLKLIDKGNKLSKEEMKDLNSVISKIKKRNGQTESLSRYAVKWVSLNPMPIQLPKQVYNR